MAKPATGLLAPPRVLSELALVALVGLIQVMGTYGASHNQPERASSGVAGYVLLSVAVAVLPLRHRFPIGVLAVTFGTTLAYWSYDFPRGPVFVAMVVAFAHVVLTGRRRAAIGTLMAGFVAFPWLGYLLGNADRPSWPALVALAAWLAVLISVMEVVRSRRDRAREAARSAAEAARRQAADERLHIARDIHDAVAHNMSLISVQAGVALHLLDESRREGDSSDDAPEQVREALDAIKGASKEALVELRSILGVLRQVDEADEVAKTAGTDEPRATEGRGEDRDGAGAPRAPVPDLRRLDDVVTRASSTGLDVHVELGVDRERLQALPHPVGVAAFRIVQESLTNVVRHSDSATAVVRIGVPDEGVLAVEILDEGPGQADRTDAVLGNPPRDAALSADLPGEGTGIAGMRERAAAVGGRLEAGPRPGRGFAVRARLPMDESPVDEPSLDEAPVGEPPGDGA